MEDNLRTLCEDMVYKRRFTKQGLKNYRRKCWFERKQEQTLLHEEHSSFVETDLKDVLDIKIEEPEITCSTEEDHHAILLDHSYSRIAIKVEPDLYNDLCQLDYTAGTSNETTGEGIQASADQNFTAAGVITPIIKLEVESDNESDVQCLDESTDEEPHYLPATNELNDNESLTNDNVQVEINGTLVELENSQNCNEERETPQRDENLTTPTPTTEIINRYNALDLHNYAKTGEPPSNNDSSIISKQLESGLVTATDISDPSDDARNKYRATSSNIATGLNLEMKNKSVPRNDPSSVSKKASNRLPKSSYVYLNVPGRKPIKLKVHKIEIAPMTQQNKQVQQVLKASSSDIRHAEYHLKLKTLPHGDKTRRSNNVLSSKKMRDTTMVKNNRSDKRNISSGRMRNPPITPPIDIESLIVGSSIKKPGTAPPGRMKNPTIKHPLCNESLIVSSSNEKPVSVLRVKTQEELNASVSSAGSSRIREPSKTANPFFYTSKESKESQTKKTKATGSNKQPFSILPKSARAPRSSDCRDSNGKRDVLKTFLIKRCLYPLPEHIKTSLNIPLSDKGQEVIDLSNAENTTTMAGNKAPTKSKTVSAKGRQYLMKSVLRKYAKMTALKTNSNSVPFDVNNCRGALDNSYQGQKGLQHLNDFVTNFPSGDKLQDTSAAAGGNVLETDLIHTVPSQTFSVGNRLFFIENQDVLGGQKLIQLPNLNQPNNEPLDARNYIWQEPSDSGANANASSNLRDPLNLLDNNQNGNEDTPLELAEASIPRDPLALLNDAVDDSSTETCDTETSSMFERFERESMFTTINNVSESTEAADTETSAIIERFENESTSANDDFTDTQSLDEVRSVGTPNQFQISISQCVENIIKNLVVEGDDNMEEVDVLRVDLNEFNKDSIVDKPVASLNKKFEISKKKKSIKKRNPIIEMTELDDPKEGYVEKRSIKEMQETYGANVIDILNEGSFSICKFCKSFTNILSSHLKRLHAEEQEVVDLFSKRKRSQYEKIVSEGRSLYDSLCISQTTKELKTSDAERTTRDPKDKNTNSPKSKGRKTNRKKNSPMKTTSTNIDVDLTDVNLPLENSSIPNYLEESSPKGISGNSNKTMRKKSLDSTEENPHSIDSPVGQVEISGSNVKDKDNSLKLADAQNNTENETEIVNAPPCISEENNDESSGKENDVENNSLKSAEAQNKIQNEREIIDAPPCISEENDDESSGKENDVENNSLKSTEAKTKNETQIIDAPPCTSEENDDESSGKENDVENNSLKSTEAQTKTKNETQIIDDPPCTSEENGDESSEKENDQAANDVSDDVIEDGNLSTRFNEETYEPDETFYNDVDRSGMDIDDDQDDSEDYSKVVPESTEIVSSHVGDQENDKIISPIVLNDNPEVDIDEEDDILAASRKYFCKFCKKLYINLPFHLDHHHGDEEEVQKLVKLPKHSSARKKLADKIRVDGNRIFNHESNYKEVYLRELRKTKENLKTRDTKKYIKCSKCSKRFKCQGFTRHMVYCEARNRKEYIQSIDDQKVFSDLDHLIAEIRAEFSQTSWLSLAKCVLTSLHVVNPKIVNIETIVITDFNKRRPFNEDEETDANLKDVVHNLKMKTSLPPEVPSSVILQKDLDGMSVLLTKNQEDGIDLLLKHRLQASVPKGSPYIFGSPVQHKETHVALLEAMQNYVKEDDYIPPTSSSSTTKELDDSAVSSQLNTSSDTSVISAPIPSKPKLSLSDIISKCCLVECSVKLNKLKPEDFFVFCNSFTSTKKNKTSTNPNTSPGKSTSGNSKISPAKDDNGFSSPAVSVIDLARSEDSTLVESESEESEFFEIPYTSSSTSFTASTNTRSSVLSKSAMAKSGTKRKLPSREKKPTRRSRSKRASSNLLAKERRKSRLLKSPISIKSVSSVQSEQDRLGASPASVVDLDESLADESSSNEPVLSVKCSVKINFLKPVINLDRNSGDQMIAKEITKTKGVEDKLATEETPNSGSEAGMRDHSLETSRNTDKRKMLKRLNLDDVILCTNCNKYYAKISYVKHRKFCVRRSVSRKRKRKTVQVKGEVDEGQEDENSKKKCPTLESPGGAKKYFCIFCKQTFTKLSRHFEHIHKDEEEVQEMLKYPKGSRRRNQILYRIRTRGTFTFNMNSEYNGGQLIVSRRPNPTLRRTNGDFLPCPYCGNYFAKKTLYRHTKRCSNGQGYQKNVKKVARAIISSVHPRSNKIMATQIIPRLIEDKVSEAIKSDELLVLLGNHLTQKHAAPKGRGYIRQNLRMVGKLLLALKAQNSSITEFSSIFHPDYCDLVIKTVMEVAGYDRATNTFKLSDFARKLGAIVKICGEVWSMECCKRKSTEQKQMIVDFLNKFGEAYKAEVYSQLKSIKPQAKPINHTGELKRLFELTQMGMLDKACKLNEDFSLEAWIDLINYLLLHLRLLNNNIHEDGESLYVSDYLQRHSLDADEDSTFYHSLGLLVYFPKNYIKVRLRGSSTYLLLSQEFCGAVDVLLENREDAGVPIENAYLFGKPEASNLYYKTSEAKAHLRHITGSNPKPNQEMLVPKREPLDVEETTSGNESALRNNEELFHYEKDLRKAFDHHTNCMLELRKKLTEGFSNQIWIDLIKCVLTCVQLMNDKTFTEVVQYLLLDDYKKRQNIGENESLDSFNSLKDNCRDYPEKFVKINLQGTPINLLLSTEICSTLDLLLQQRSSANINEQNPYVFGCSGNKYNYYRTEGCIGSLPVSSDEEILSLRSRIINGLMKTGTSKIDLSKLLPNTRQDLIDNATRVFYYSQSKMVELKYKLEENFASEIWLDLIKCLLTYIHLLNDRSPEDPERLLISDYRNRRSLEFQEDSSSYHSSPDELSDYPQNYLKVKVGNSPYYLLLSLEFCETVDLLLRHRQNAGVHVDNAYVFGCRGSKENFFRANGAIAQLAPRCGVRCLKYFKAKVVGGVIVSQEQTVEAKVIPKIEEDAYLKKRTFEQCQKQSDAPVIKTEESNSNGVHRRRWTDEEMEVARREFEVCLKQGYLPSMYQCQQVISGNVELKHRTPEQLKAWINNQIQKLTGKVRSRGPAKSSTGKQVIRCRWSTAEQDIVRLYLGDYLMSRTLPSSAECRKMIASNPEMSHRTSEHVRAWINNQNKKRNNNQ